MGFQDKPSSASSTSVGSKSLSFDSRMTSQTCLNGDKAGKETDKHLSIPARIWNVIKCKFQNPYPTAHINFNFKQLYGSLAKLKTQQKTMTYTLKQH
jgi:hypothetical protein